VTCDEWVENEYYQDEQTVAIVAAGAKALGVSVGNIESSCTAICLKHIATSKHACGSICPNKYSESVCLILRRRAAHFRGLLR
jgi:hypothetical protein